jgi:hypothetical protein
MSKHDRELKPTSPNRLQTRAVIAIVVWIEAIAFLFSAYLHTGNYLSFLPDFFRDPEIRGAPVVEGACGIFLAVAAVVVTWNLANAWGLAVVAHGAAIVADIVGMILIAMGAGPDSPFNYYFHRVGVAILIIVLGCLFTLPARMALRGGGPGLAAS